MSDVIETELKKTFDEAVMQFAQNRLRTAEDWQQAGEITRRYDERRTAMSQAFHDSYDERVKQKRADLSDGHARFAPPPPRPHASRSSGHDLIRIAHALVKQEHNQDLARLRQAQRNEMEELAERASGRDQRRGDASTDFFRATDRRSGLERRTRQRTIE